MKLVHDLSVTSLRGSTGAIAWDAPWAAPLSGTRPNLVLDFAAGIYGVDGAPSGFAGAVNFFRASPGSYVNSAGIMSQAVDNTARFDHDPLTLAPKGLLLEAARTNLVTGSAAPSNQTVTVGAVPHVLSFFGTGSVIMAGAHVGSVNGTGAYPARTSVSFTPSAGDLDLSFTGAISNVQLEEGSVASSFIQTGASSDTRTNDVAITALGPWFDSDEGTLVFSGMLLDAAANDRIIELDAGNTTTRLSVLWNSNLGKPQFQVWNNGALQAAIGPGGNSVPLNTAFRVAVSFKANDFAISLNGSDVVTDTLGAMPTGLGNLRIGRSIWGAQGLLEAESLVYYPARLSDAELQTLSS